MVCSSWIFQCNSANKLLVDDYGWPIVSSPDDEEPHTSRIQTKRMNKAEEGRFIYMRDMALQYNWKTGNMRSFKEYIRKETASSKVILTQRNDELTSRIRSSDHTPGTGTRS